jgi:cellulose synthase/poly-beta-1,6-N-acetylglucosamine synthase-like glycosyltransferase
MRKSLYEPLDIALINDDMELTLTMVKAGYRVIYEPEALASEEASKTLHEDFRVKARMVCGGFQIIQKHAAFLFYPFRFFSLQFFSHKILRYLMPVLLMILYLSTCILALSTKDFALLLFLGAQTLFYFASLFGYFLYETSGSARLLYFPLYFSYMNFGALVGLYYFLCNQSPTAIWKKAER